MKQKLLTQLVKAIFEENKKFDLDVELGFEYDSYKNKDDEIDVPLSAIFYKQEIFVFKIDYVKDKNRWDIVDKGCNYGKAAKKICDRLNMEIKEHEVKHG